MDMVKIPNKDYYLGRTTVTQGQWKSVMGTEPWKGQPYGQEGDDYPATYVSWEDAVAFCKKLSGIESRTYRLPTEAEWEYACLAGATTSYHFGDDSYGIELGKYAWFNRNAWNANRVALKLPNKFGLYDMHGNVWEWCSDWYDESQKHRVLRGGSWFSISGSCSAWCRNDFTPVNRNSFIGFRLAIST